MKKYLAIIGISFLFVGCTTVSGNDAYEKCLREKENELNCYAVELNDYERQILDAEKDSGPVVSDSGDFIIGAGLAALFWYFCG